jgi:hypothetical protein
MLPTTPLPANRHPSLPESLSVSANNFAKYNDLWISTCAYSFGKSGEQLRSNRPVPLSFPKPVRNALRVHTISGDPIPGDYVYKRESIGEEEVALIGEMEPVDKAIYTDNLPLSDAAQAKLDRDEVSHQHDIDRRTKDDNECHAMLAANISADSQSSIRLHAGYLAYANCPEPYHRSLLYHRIITSLHRYGDASTKHVRTSALFQFKQEGAFTPWLDDFNGKFEQFVADFESADQPGYIHLGELKSFLILNSIDRKQFRSVFDEQLRATPTGRFPDVVGLIKVISDYDHHHKLSLADPVSSQGSAFIAPGFTSLAKAPASGAIARDRRPRTHKDPCPICLKKWPDNPHHGHTAETCRQAKKKAFAATTETTDPDDAPTVASLALSQRRLEQNIASLVSALTLDQDANLNA